MAEDDPLARRIIDLEAELAALKVDARQQRQASKLPRRAQTGLPMELEEYVGGPSRLIQDHRDRPNH